jgi:ubiquinone/menaquinone biosynthesis C-methylase UbiE
MLSKQIKSDNLTPDKVKSYYEDWTERYVRTFGQTFQSFQTANVEDLFNYFIMQSGMHDGMKILDAGCGVCGPAIYFAGKMGIQLEALTISELQCQIAEENIRKSETKLRGQINVKRGDFHELEKLYPEESFDLIYFFEALTHSKDPATVLKSCQKVLKKGGTVYIKDLYYRKSDNEETIRKINIAVANVEEKFALRVKEIGDFLSIIEQSGFQIEFNQTLQIEGDYSLGNKFVADNGIIIYENQDSPYDGMGVPYLDYFETKIQKL